MKENNILGHDVSSILSISIGKDTRGVHLLWSNCHQQNILRCPTQLNILLKSQLGWHSFLWLCERPMLTINTKVMVYQACLLSLLLYGNETWILNNRQKHCLSSLHIHFLNSICAGLAMSANFLEDLLCGELAIGTRPFCRPTLACTPKTSANVRWKLVLLHSSRLEQ